MSCQKRLITKNVFIEVVSKSWKANLFGMPIIEPFPFGHTVEFALSWGFQVGNPIVVLPLKQLLIELCTLLLPVYMVFYRLKWCCSYCPSYPSIHFKPGSHLKSLAPLGQGWGLQVANLLVAPTHEFGRGLLQLRTHVSTPPPHVLQKMINWR